MMAPIPARRFEGRVAAVTAGGSGMGRAAALRLAAEGAHVCVVDIDEAAATATAAAARDAGGEAEPYRCDVSSVEQLRGLFRAMEERHGILHVLFNNAGIPGAAGVEVSEEEWEWAVGINLKSAYFASSLAVPLLERAAGHAAIVFNASTGGEVGSDGAPLYGMTKGGVTLLMKSLALTLAPKGIRVNAVSAGPIKTMAGKGIPGFDQISGSWARRAPLGWDVEDPTPVGNAVAFLLSDLSSGITGELVHVDGGFHAMGTDLI